MSVERPPDAIELPKDQWYVLRDPEDVPERLRRNVQKAARRRAASAQNIDLDPEDVGELRDGQDAKRQADIALRALVSMTDETIDGVAAYQVAVMVALVKSWSFGSITPEVAVDLPSRAYDLIVVACDPLADKMFLDTEPDPMSPNSTAPGGGSPDSAPLSPEAQITTSLTSSAPTYSSESA